MSLKSLVKNLKKQRGTIANKSRKFRYYGTIDKNENSDQQRCPV